MSASKPHSRYEELVRIILTPGPHYPGHPAEHYDSAHEELAHAVLALLGQIEFLVAGIEDAQRLEEQVETLERDLADAIKILTQQRDEAQKDALYIKEQLEAAQEALAAADTAARLNADLHAAAQAQFEWRTAEFHSAVAHRRRVEAELEELRATLAESVTPHGVSDLHDAPASEEELPSSLPLGLTQSRHKDILSNVSNRTISAIDRLEARGGWDEGDLNDFAIVREAVSNPASELRVDEPLSTDWWRDTRIDALDESNQESKS